MATPTIYGLQLKGQSDWLRTEKGEPYHNTEWGPTQLENIARFHGVPLDQVEVVQMGWSLEEVRNGIASKLVILPDSLLSDSTYLQRDGREVIEVEAEQPELRPGELRCTCAMGERDPDCEAHNAHEAAYQ